MTNDFYEDYLSEPILSEEELRAFKRYRELRRREQFLKKYHTIGKIIDFIFIVTTLGALWYILKIN
jgi:hypothetical protein